MSLTQRKKTAARPCRSCGGPAGNRALCSKCSPRKRNREHRDKYADRDRAPDR